MLISCMCLNLIASSNDLEEHQKLLHRDRQNASNASYHIEVDETADRKSLKQLMSISPERPIDPVNVYDGESSHRNSNNNNNNNNHINNNVLGTYLKNSFLQKYQSDFIFYSPCMDFYKQAIGPVTDVTINAINQRDLIYSLTLEVPIEKSLETWQLSICINCNYVFCAKKLQGRLNTPPSPLTQQFLFNSSLITNSDEISRRKADKSFSDTFGILIMDHPEVNKQNGFSSSNTMHNGNQSHSLKTPTLPLATFTIGSLSSTSNLQLNSKQQRLRELHCNLQQYVNREIAETNERIQRYTEQQFALLKSFREKSEQEYELLVRLIQKVPDQNGEMLDRLPPMLEVTMGAVNYSRRRNTISSRRDLNTQTPTTPTTPNTNQPHQPPIFLNLNSFISNNTGANDYSLFSAMERNQNVNRTNTSNQHLAVPSSTQQTTKNQSISSVAVSTAPTSSTTLSSVSVGAGNTAITTPPPAGTTTTVVSNILNRKMSNFDTPPATPEATPMSIGNSPTFKQQNPPSIQQHQQSQSTQKQIGNQQRHHQTPTVVHFQQLPLQHNGSRLDNNHQFYQKSDFTDNCVFELEDDDSLSINNSSSNSIPVISPPIAYPQQNLHFQLQLQRNLQHHYHHHHHNNNDNTMSDLDESDVAEEAEDALDLDTSMPIPMIKTPSRSTSNNSSSQMINFAKSLPIEIANSPMAARSYIDDSEEEVLDNTLDIAASIKALAKSVHGEAVFGDLPRPRLRSQI